MPPFFLLSVIEGLAALVALFLIPSEGISLARLALMGVILLPFAASLYFFIRSLNTDWRARVTAALTARPGLLRALAFASPLLFLTFGLVLFLLRYYNPEATASYYVRARPALTYLLLLAAQTSLWLNALRNGIHFKSMKMRRAVFVSAGIVFTGFIVLWLVIVLTGFGVTKDTSYWGEPGVPILGWQLLIALIVAFLASSIFHLSSFSSRRISILIPVFVWLLAFVLWMSVPLSSLRNSFYAPITPPYNQPFPASDAAYYDTDAQNLLMGNGFVHSIPTRPFFILFLAGLHTLFGQEYARLVLGQTLVYALLPVALYFLGKQLHSRAAGVTAALLAIFRELTSLWVASDVRVSNTKMLLSEFITTLVMIAYLLLVLRWFREKRNGPLLAFVSGGALGLQLLLRTQTAFLAPGILLLAFFVLWPDWKRWFAQSVIFAAGMALAVSPWLIRNYTITGSASLDDPIQIKAVASMYSGGTPTSNFPQFEGQTPEQISAFVVDTILHHPGYVAGFVTNQFFANTIDTFLVLPMFARYDGLTAPIFPYWYEWSEYLSPANILLFVVYLAVIALGFAAAWKRFRWASLLPLAAFLFYALSTSLARYSGWRYIFPVDWVGYFYFAIGAAELFLTAAALFGRSEQLDTYPVTQVNELPATRRPSPVLPFLLSAFCFLSISSLPWVAETVIPQKPILCVNPVLECFPLDKIEEAQAIEMLTQPHSILTGRVLYPRYFSRNDGLASTNPAPAFAPRDFPRMSFLLLKDGHIEQIILPMKGSRPFPHFSDAVIWGCWRDTYFEARFVLIPATGEIFTNGALSDACSP
ncbi:MAG: glycosyltransferase family 39 protein [Chloroflexota bacterium]